ncbi:uncharacterized protein [Pagrus major]|uniref:uncharacterized protein n=1 Tax=Pagrus major TaxID=143350 RepID=UPI003CC861DE
MMVEFKWIQMSLFLTAMLQFTAVTGLNHTSISARVGDEVTLPCDNVIKHQDKCDSTSWLANRYGVSAKQLVNLGRISKSEIPKSKSDRLMVTESCSLVIKNVTVEDVGRYNCRQFNKSGKQQGEDALVHLSVVNVEKHQVDGRDILICYVLSYTECGHTVKWLYDDNMDGVETVRLGCSARVTFKTPHLNQKFNYYKLPECEVTDDQSGQTLLWNDNSGSKTSAEDDTPPQLARTDCPVVNYIMLVLRVAELVLITVITVLLIRAGGNQRPVRRSRAAASQVDHDEDEDDGVVKYENCGDTSASVRLH